MSAAGFLVQKTMPSTASGDSEIFEICLALNGFLTETEPCRSLFMNQGV